MEQELIETILQKVLERLPAAVENSGSENAAGKQVLIIGKPECPYTKEILSIYKKGQACLFETVAYGKGDFEEIVIPYLSRKNIVHISMGLSATEMEECVLYWISRNRPLKICHHELEVLSNCCNPSLYETLKGHLLKLEEYGLYQFCPEENHGEGKSHDNLKGLDSGILDLGHLPLICESHLASAKNGSQVFIKNSKTILTPSAKDIVRQKNLRIVIQNL